MSKKRTTRDKTERVKTAKGRKTSSTKWLKRQLNDPYVAKAQMDGYRGRAAYKLIEINEKIDILHPDMMVVDLGAAPGGWCQVASQAGCKVVGLDILEMDPIPDVTLLQMDFNDDDAPDRLKAYYGAGRACLLFCLRGFKAGWHFYRQGSPRRHRR